MKAKLWVLNIVLALTLGLPSHVGAKAKKPPSPKQSIERYSLNQGEPLKPKAKKARLPFIVYGDTAGQEIPYIPSGYMGDTDSLSVTTAYESAPLATGDKGSTSLKVQYSAKGREGWAGVYWLTPANNWGRKKGAGYDLSRAKQLTFWVRGEKGGETIEQIKVGGITASPYPDSGEASIGPLRLSQDWEQYVIDLERVDTRHIVGGFAFVVRRIDNRKGIKFYLDEIVFEKDNTVISEMDQLVEEFEPSEDKIIPLAQPIRRVIPFNSATTAFQQESKEILDDIVDAADRHRAATVIVEGHTDDLGPAEINMRLSRERANAIADYLATRGLSRARIIVIGYGEERPLSPNSNESDMGRRKNRRVEIVLIKSQ